MSSNVIQPAGIGEVAVVGLGLMGSGIVELVARGHRPDHRPGQVVDDDRAGQARIGAALPGRDPGWRRVRPRTCVS